MGSKHLLMQTAESVSAWFGWSGFIGRMLRKDKGASGHVGPPVSFDETCHLDSVPHRARFLLCLGSMGHSSIGCKFSYTGIYAIV